MTLTTFMLLDEARGPIPVEVNDDGRCTVWSYSMWGPIGQSGFPKRTPRPPHNKRELKLLTDTQVQMRRNLEKQRSLAACLGNNPNINTMKIQVPAVAPISKRPRKG